MATTRARIASLDIIRGVAVMGILLMNIYAFALPTPAYANPSAYGGDSGLDLLLWGMEFVFIDSKMRGLFSLLFGASTLLVIERARAREDRPALRHYARMLWLLAFGLVHFWFIWWGDILALYAQCGLLLYLWRNSSVKVLRNWAIGLIGVSTILFNMNALYFTSVQNGMIEMSASERASFDTNVAAITSYFGDNDAAEAKDIARYRDGTYASIVDSRFIDERFKPFTNALGLLPETLGIMLIGMALFRSGLLTGDWSPERTRRWARNAFLIATPPLVALAAWQVASGFAAMPVFWAAVAASVPFDILMAVGWAALVTLWAQHRPDGSLQRRVAAAGRMAFTNYLTTSIVMTTLFYGYGGALYASLGRATLLLFVVAMWGLMLLWSKPWLERFHYGPFEWLWRSLSRFRLQPFVRTAA